MNDPFHRVHPLLGRFALVCALSGVPAATTMAQGVACDAMAQQALNLRAFRKAVDAYANLLPRPEAASTTGVAAEPFLRFPCWVREQRANIFCYHPP